MIAIVVRFTTKKEEFKFFTTEHLCFTWFWWNLFDIDYQHTETAVLLVGRSACGCPSPASVWLPREGMLQRTRRLVRQLGSPGDGNVCIVGLLTAITKRVLAFP